MFAEQTGVLPDISVSLDKDGASKANASDLALALEWCADNHVGLVSLSMGTTQFSDVPILRKAVDKLSKAGTILVAASCNEKRITFPAAFGNCIGVCQTRLLEDGQLVYIKRPFDGVNVVVSNIGHGSNSVANAYVAGKIFMTPDYISNLTVKPDLNWNAAYLNEKIRRNDAHEPIIIACYDAVKELQRIIIKDGYTCAVLSEKGLHQPSQYRFSLRASPLSPKDTFNLVVSLCRPDVILHNINELFYLSDVVADENKSPYDLWMRVKELFE